MCMHPIHPLFNNVKKYKKTILNNKDITGVMLNRKSPKMLCLIQLSNKKNNNKNLHIYEN